MTTTIANYDLTNTKIYSITQIPACRRCGKRNCPDYRTYNLRTPTAVKPTEGRGAHNRAARRRTARAGDGR